MDIFTIQDFIMKTVLQIAALLIIVFSFSPSANGQQVVLDMSFGDSGKVITAPDTTSTINEIAIQPDGKIVAVGYLGLTTWQRRFLIVRYNHDGSLDTSFGMRGKLDLNMTNNQDEARSVFIQPDGKIVVGGIAEDTIHHTSYFTILRLKPNGNFDSTFGSNHNGIVKTHANPTNNFSDDDLKKILRLPNGKILCGGSTLTSVSDTGFCFVQLDTNGVQDPSFGFYGRKIFQRKYPRNYMNMGLQSSGKVIAAMAISLDVYEVVRLLPNGNIDSTFGINGSIPPYVNTDTGLISALGLAIQDDDKIVLSGSVRGLYNYITVVRITANGAFDTSFGGTGKIINPAGLINGYGSSVNMLPNGGILIGGTIYPPSSYSNFVIMQLRANGSLDTTFGRRGLVFTDFKKGGDRSSCLLLQPGSGIVIAGTTASTAAYTKMALARYYTAALKTNFVHLETFVDKNANGTREPSEPFFTEANVVAYKAGNSDTRFNASGGKFNIETDTGTYLWKLPVFANYTIVPASYTTAHSTYFNQDSFAFGLQPVPGYKNLAITVVPLSPMRRYMPMQYLIVCTNKGTDTLSSSYRFVMDSNLVFFSASQMPASIVGDTISWNFSNLAPWDTTQVLLTLKFGQPASVSIGDTLTSFANVMPATGEPDTTDNKTTLIQIVRGSIDPNDKTENHGGKISTTEVASGDYLQYTIRFQNSGNDTAFNVYIHDTLDSKLDWSTM